MAGTGKWAALPVSNQLDPQVLALSIEAEVFYVRAWLYAGEHSTDGLIPVGAYPLLSLKLTTDPIDLAEELAHAGLAKRRQGHDIVLVDYRDWNPSAKMLKQRVEVGRQSAMKRWGKQKPSPEDGDTGEDGSMGDPMGDPSGTDMGLPNTRDDTRRNGTKPPAEVGGYLDIDEVDNCVVVNSELSPNGHDSRAIDVAPPLEMNLEAERRRLDDFTSNFGKVPF